MYAHVRSVPASKAGKLLVQSDDYVITSSTSERHNLCRAKTLPINLAGGNDFVRHIFDIFNC